MATMATAGGDENAAVRRLQGEGEQEEEEEEEEADEGRGEGRPSGAEEEEQATNSSSSCACDQDGGGALESTASPAARKKKVKIMAFVTASFIEDVAREYEALRGDSDSSPFEIDVTYVYTLPDMFAEVMNEATFKGGLYDGFVTLPLILGSAVQAGGWRDLTPSIRSSDVVDWPDVLLSHRELQQYEGRVYMYPFDGDLHSLFYRKDVLAELGLPVPRTWAEYNAVAAAAHGRAFENRTLVGSCVDRNRGCAAPFFAAGVLSTMTQARGSSEGSLFDTGDMRPLAGEALEETLRLLEGQAEHGAPDEFDEASGCLEVNERWMNDGACVLTYNWGFQFKNHVIPPSRVAGKMGVAMMPGSRRVLDRETMKLEECTKETCRLGRFYEDVEQEPGWVNLAPYPASGGWSGAISAHARAENQKFLDEFFEYACSYRGSIARVVPNVTDPSSAGFDAASINHQDPWRKSHLDVKTWTEMGYEEEGAREYRNAIVRSLEHPNRLADVRFPAADRVMAILDEEVHGHLLRVKGGEIGKDDRPAARAEVAARVAARWNEVVAAHDAREDTPEPLLTTYQRLRGVYAREEELNQLTALRPVGWALGSVVLALSVFFAAWTFVCRKDRVVRAGQPLFLYLVVGGCVIMGSAIFPMGVDDSIASDRGCTMACRSVPWLVALGFTTAFSALFSKIWRVKQLFEHAASFKRVQISERDVLLPFAVLFTLNVIFLLVWTLVDPLNWKRIPVEGSDGNNSYGVCVSDGVVSVVSASLILAFNVCALILANIQAYQARKVETEYAESSYVAIATLLILQVLLVGVPITFLVRDNPPADFFIRVCIVFVMCAATLLLVFMPKVAQQRNATKRKDRQISGLSKVSSVSRFVGPSTHSIDHTSNCPRGSNQPNAPPVTDQADSSRSSTKLTSDALDEYKRKVDDLSKELQEQGFDAESLFKKVGIWESTRKCEAVSTE